MSPHKGGNLLSICAALLKKEQVVLDVSELTLCQQYEQQLRFDGRCCYSRHTQ
jgi:hypothetical protein